MMKISDTQDGWKKTGMQLILAIVVAFAGVSLATQAAFPDTPEKSLSENDNFWQSIESAQAERATQDTSQNETTRDEQDAQKEIVPPAHVSVNASSYVVADLQTGKLLAGKHIDTPRPIASITKLMTAVIAHETIGDETTINITPAAAATYGSAGGLSAGDSMPLSVLYYPLLLSSSNDAAAAIAAHNNRQNFLNLMSRKALVIGMQRARFADASGLSAKNVASPRGLLALSRYIYQKNPFIFSITTSAQKTIPPSLAGEQTVFTNNHPLHSQPNFLGGKNGYTDEANHTLLSLFRIEKESDSRPVAIIVLGSDTQTKGTRTLLKWVRQS